MKKFINKKILNGYMAFLETLSPSVKLDLISMLTESLKSGTSPREPIFQAAFGAWAGPESADEIAQTIRNSRSFNRKLEDL